MNLYKKDNQTDKIDSMTREDPQKFKKPRKRSGHHTLESNILADASKSSESCWIYVGLEGS